MLEDLQDLLLRLFIALCLAAVVLVAVLGCVSLIRAIQWVWRP